MHLLTRYEKIEPYITKDGSIIRELMHPAVHGNSNQSLAEPLCQQAEKLFFTGIVSLKKFIILLKAAE